MSWLPLLKIIAAGSFLLEGTGKLQLLKRLGERRSKGEGSEEGGTDQAGRMEKLPVEGGGKSLGRIGQRLRMARKGCRRMNVQGRVGRKEGFGMANKGER